MYRVLNASLVWSAGQDMAALIRRGFYHLCISNAVSRKPRIKLGVGNVKDALYILPLISQSLGNHGRARSRIDYECHLVVVSRTLGKLQSSGRKGLRLRMVLVPFGYVIIALRVRR